MGDPVLEAGEFTVSIGGINWRLRRRSSLMMLQARGFPKVAGALAGFESVRRGDNAKAKLDPEEAKEMVRSILELSMIEPALASGEDEPAPPRTYSLDQIAPFADALFLAVMNSGLSLDPTPGCCGETLEQ